MSGYLLAFLRNCFHVSLATSLDFQIINCTFMFLSISQGAKE